MKWGGYECSSPSIPVEASILRQEPQPQPQPEPQPQPQPEPQPHPQPEPQPTSAPLVEISGDNPLDETSSLANFFNDMKQIVEDKGIKVETNPNSTITLFDDASVVEK